MEIRRYELELYFIYLSEAHFHFIVRILEEIDKHYNPLNKSRVWLTIKCVYGILRSIYRSSISFYIIQGVISCVPTSSDPEGIILCYNKCVKEKECVV